MKKFILFTPNIGEEKNYEKHGEKYRFDLERLNLAANIDISDVEQCYKDYLRHKEEYFANTDIQADFAFDMVVAFTENGVYDKKLIGIATFIPKITRHPHEVEFCEE